MSRQEPNNNSTVLVVDDVAQNLDLLEYGLKAHKFNVMRALNTTEARAILLTNKIDILLLDINMPGQDGLSFCKELREIERFELLPIVFVSSVDRDFGFKEAILKGGDDFINKPINLNELVAKVNAFIRIKKLQDQLLEYKRQKEEEINMARMIQSHLVPNRNIEWKGFKIQTLFQPFNQIGGDFFDFTEENDKLHFIIADCSGRGVSASLLSAMLKMQIKSLPENITLLDRTKILREKLTSVLPRDFYITFIMGIFSPNMMLEFINGGHPSAIHCRKDEITLLNSNTSLIINEEVEFEDATVKIQLEKGSRLLFYTDGASEVINKDYKMLGTEGLVNLFREAIQLEGSSVENLLDKIFAFSGKNQLEDDITLISVEI